MHMEADPLNPRTSSAVARNCPLPSNHRTSSTTCFTSFICSKESTRIEPKVVQKSSFTGIMVWCFKGDGVATAAARLRDGAASALQRCCMRIDTMDDCDEGSDLPLNYNK